MATTPPNELARCAGRYWQTTAPTARFAPCAAQSKPKAIRLQTFPLSFALSIILYADRIVKCFQKGKQVCLSREFLSLIGFYGY